MLTDEYFYRENEEKASSAVFDSSHLIIVLILKMIRVQTRNKYRRKKILKEIKFGNFST